MPLSIGEIMRILSGKGRSLMVILLSLPFCQPIQIPGFSTPFGLAVAFVGLRMAFGKNVWLPKKLLTKEIPAHSLDKITNTTLMVVRKIKPWIRPRWVWLSQSPPMLILNGMLVCLLGIVLALPLPVPFSNLLAAWSLFLISLGMLEDDGVVVFIGYISSLLTVLLLVATVLTVKRIF